MSITTWEQLLHLITESDRGAMLSANADPVDPANPSYIYLPENGYVGKDKAIFLVDFGNGLKVKVNFFFHDVAKEEATTPCGGSDYSTWKISSNLDANGAISSVDLSSWLSLAQLDSKIADMSHGGKNDRRQRIFDSLVFGFPGMTKDRLLRISYVTTYRSCRSG